MNTPEQRPLDLGDGPENMEPMREAFEKSGLRDEGYNFERAMRNDAIRRGLRNIAEHLLNARGRHLAVIAPIQLPPLEDLTMLCMVAVVLAGAAICCIVALIRRNT